MQKEEMERKWCSAVFSQEVVIYYVPVRGAGMAWVSLDLLDYLVLIHLIPTQKKKEIPLMTQARIVWSSLSLSLSPPGLFLRRRVVNVSPGLRSQTQWRANTGNQRF